MNHTLNVGLSADYTSLDHERKILLQQMDSLKTLLQGRFKYAAEIGNGFVYLRYFLTCCHRHEETIMLNYGFHADHRYYEKYHGLKKDIGCLLKRVIDVNSSATMIIDASNQILDTLQDHIDRFDSNLHTCAPRVRHDMHPY